MDERKKTKTEDCEREATENKHVGKDRQGREGETKRWEKRLIIIVDLMENVQ